MKKVILIKSPSEYDKLINEGLVVVDFFTDWCGPCKNFSPIFEEIAKKNPGTTFLSVNAEQIEHPDCENIKSLPTFKIFLNGKLRREFSGVNKEKLEEYIQRFKIQIQINGKILKKFSPELKESIISYMENYS